MSVTTSNANFKHMRIWWLYQRKGKENLVVPWFAIVAYYDYFICLTDILIFHMSDVERCDQIKVDDIKNLILEIKDDIVMYGYKFYKSLKNWHPSVISVILKNDVGLVNKLEEETLDKMPPSNLKNRLEGLSIEDCSREIDLAGLCKCFTTPVIDISSSVAKCLASSIPKLNLGPQYRCLVFH